MSDNEFNKRGDTVTINGVSYFLRCDYARDEKVPGQAQLFGIKVGITVIRLSDNKILEWSEIKNTYIAEKITDYIENSINGQRSFYWNYIKE